MSSPGIFVSCPTSRGRSTSSTLPTTSAQNSARAMPRQTSPVVGGRAAGVRLSQGWKAALFRSRARS